MRILVLTHEFPPVGGGGGRVAMDIAGRLASSGHELRVITSHLDGLPVMEEIAGVQVQRVTPLRREAFRAGFFEMARYDWSAVMEGLRVVREWQPNVIHAHFAVPAGAAAFVISKLTGVPYVLTAHLGDVPGAVPEKTDRWFRWIYPFTPAIWRGAARVVAVSDFTRRLAQKYYNVPVDVIHNGVDVGVLPVHKPSGPVPHIVFAGRFVEQKNPIHLVDALARLKDLAWQCSMLGDGPLLGAAREKAADQGLAERVSLSGWVTPEEVLAVFSRSDILVLPSRSEGLSVVGVQALGMGLALVLSDAGGNNELVSNRKNGFLYPVDDLDALTVALRTLLENPTMLQSAQQRSLELARKFDLEHIVRQYETLFEHVRRRDPAGVTS